MSKWTSYKISDLCSSISDTYKGNDEYVVLVNTSDVLEGKILNHTLTENKNLKGQFKKTFKKNDILYSEIRPANKRFAFVDIENTDNYIASTKLMVLRCNEEKVLPKYLFALLKSNSIIKELQLLAETRSGTFPQITFSGELGPIEIMLPDFETQQKIISILESIENKMDNTIEISSCLYNIAQNIYNNYLTSNENCVTYKSINELGEVKGGKRLPKGSSLQAEKNNHPYIRVRDLNDIISIQLNDEFEYVDDETQKSISRYIVHTSDVLISIVGTIGLTAIVHDSLENANLTENCVKITNMALLFPEYLLLFLRSKEGQEAMIKGTVGAVQAKLPIKNIQSIQIPILDGILMEELRGKIHPLFNMIAENVGENQNLVKIRDNLLSRLLKGEIDLTDIDI